MKLRPEEVAVIVDRLMADWKAQGLATFKVTEQELQLRLNDIFLKELKVEDDLNREVDQMLEKYEAEFTSGRLDRRKMFLMVRNQLVKDKKIVL